MSGTTRSPAKKAAAKRAASATPLEAVAEPQEPLDPAVQAMLDLEQANLNNATLVGQVNYLSGRVADLVKENYELRAKADES